MTPYSQSDIVNDMKRCSKCKEYKEVSQFAKRTKSSDGLQSTCRSCNNRAVKAHRQANPEALTRQFHRTRRRQYGLTEDQYEEIRTAEERGDLCPLCQIRPSNTIDHDHETELYRGHICGPCNTALATFGDNLAGITRVLNYLTRAPSV